MMRVEQFTGEPSARSDATTSTPGVTPERRRCGRRSAAAGGTLSSRPATTYTAVVGAVPDGGESGSTFT